MIADEACRTMVLTPGARHRLDKHEERLAPELHRYLLAGRFRAEPEAGE